MKKQMKGNIMLMLTAIIWGTAFVAQKAGMDLIGPIAFNGIRTLVGAGALVPVILIMNRKKKEKEPEIDKDTICQFTEMYDCNATPIWEYDKCVVTRPGVVAYGSVNYHRP